MTMRNIVFAIAILCGALFTSAAAAQVPPGNCGTISSCPSVGSLTGSEFFPVVQGGVTKKALVSQLPYATGPVAGPTSSTINDCAVWNNATGTLLKDQPCPLVFVSIAALRLNTLLAKTAHVQCYVSPSVLCAGGGDFEEISADTSSVDNSCTIIVDASNHRWYRQIPAGYYTFAMCGAVGNGTANDTTAVNQTYTVAMTAASGSSGKVCPDVNPQTAAGLIDGQGKTYAISNATQIPAGCGLTVQNANFVVTGTWPGASTFMTATEGSGGSFVNEFLTFRNVTWDGDLVASCTDITSSNYIRFDNTFCHRAAAGGYGLYADSNSANVTGAKATWSCSSETANVPNLGCIAADILAHDSVFTDHSEFIGDSVPSGAPIWTSGASIAANQFIRPAAAIIASVGPQVWQAENSGTTGVSQPAFASHTTPGNTVTDNGITWKNMGAPAEALNSSAGGNKFIGDYISNGVAKITANDNRVVASEFGPNGLWISGEAYVVLTNNVFSASYSATGSSYDWFMLIAPTTGSGDFPAQIKENQFVDYDSSGLSECVYDTSGGGSIATVSGTISDNEHGVSQGICQTRGHLYSGTIPGPQSTYTFNSSSTYPGGTCPFSSVAITKALATVQNNAGTTQQFIGIDGTPTVSSIEVQWNANASNQSVYIDWSIEKYQ